MDENQQQKESLRFSVPPYWVGTMVDNIPILTLPGRMYAFTERGMAPSAEDVREILIELRAKLGWSRPGFAALLGVSHHVLRRWETGDRNPSGAARRLIWLLDMFVRRPGELRNAMDLIAWGKADELLEVSRALSPQD